MKKILLTTLNAKYIHINLAIRLLYELNKNDQRLSFREYTIKDDLNKLAKELSDFEVIAFSCYIWNISQTLELAKYIKEINSDVKILLGGPEVSFEFDDVIMRPYVDYIITDEGEIPFTEFLQQYPDVSGVANLVYKVGDKYFHNIDKNKTIFSLDGFADINPYCNDSPESLAQKVLYVETSRGCPYKCGFCLAGLDNKVRFLPEDCVKTMLLYLMQNGKTIKFLDRTFNVKKDFTINMFKFILENYKEGNLFQFEITADILHQDIIDFIKNNVPKGLFRFEIGIQTVNEVANNSVGRRQNFEKIKNVINQLSDNVEMHLDLIVGLPLDYFDNVKNSIEEVFSLFAPELQLGFLKMLKGSPVRKNASAHGFIYDPNPPYQIIRSNYLSEAEIDHIIMVENALEIFWNGKKTINSLKYVSKKYSIFDFLYGLATQFKQRASFYKYTLYDIFEVFSEFIEKEYPEDNILKQLIAIDYYLYAKLKPKDLFNVDFDVKTKKNFINTNNIDIQKHQVVFHKIDFNFNEFVNSMEIVYSNSVLMYLYNGKNKATYVLR